ncbi:MAG: sulfatase-like hydrolase/transferase, partial [Betaproteobacteria bacterium]
HGVRGNGYGLSLRANTFVEVLRRAGYRTALVGKSHLQNITGAPPLLPRDPAQRAGGEAMAPDAGRYDQESASSWRVDPERGVDLPYYGFDTLCLSIGHGDDQEGHYLRWLRSQRPDADNLTGPAKALPTPEFELSRCRQAWRTRLPEALYPTAWCAAETIACLEEFARTAAPFFLLCSFPDPHHPLTPPGRYWSMYDPAQIELPRSFHARHRHPPRHVRLLWQEREEGRARSDTPDAFACSEREAREAIALTYGLVTCIDDAVARVLEALGRLGLTDDTIVAFTSDHGDLMGDHRLLLKSPIHYQGLLRVPLLWRDPTASGNQRGAALVGTLDIARTVLERAGMPAYNGMQGASMLGQIRGEPSETRAALLVEQEGQRPIPGFEPPMRMRTLVTGRHRLTVYEEHGEGELYDLEADPDELDNLWDSPGHAATRSDLSNALVRAMIAHGETSPFPSARA